MYQTQSINKSYLLMLLPEHQITSCLNPGAWQSSKFLRERREPKWFLDVPTRIICSRYRRGRVVLSNQIRSTEADDHPWIENTHLSVSIDCPGECICKPVQSDRFQDIIRREGIIDPFTEFLANPEYIRSVSCVK